MMSQSGHPRIMGLLARFIGHICDILRNMDLKERKAHYQHSWCGSVPQAVGLKNTRVLLMLRMWLT